MEENLWKTLQLTNDWLRYSDTKAVALLGIQGVLLGFLVKAFDGTLSNLTCLQYILSVFGLFFNIISMFFSFICLNPKLKVKDSSKSPIYFGSIALGFKNADQYIEFIKNTFNTEDQITYELSKQIYINSKIAYNKFKNVTYSLRFFVSSLIFWFVLLITIL